MHAGGRPPIFDTEEALQNKVEEYFEHIKGDFHYEAKGEEDVKVWDRPSEKPTLTGMAFFLGFESRQSIYDYEKSGQFSYTIKRARLRIESSYEQHLLTPVSTGAIFALKNFGWSDKQEVISTNTNLNAELPEDKLKEIAKKLDADY